MWRAGHLRHLTSSTSTTTQLTQTQIRGTEQTDFQAQVHPLGIHTLTEKDS